MAAPKYYQVQGENGGRNYLFVVTRWHTLNIGWTETDGGPAVYSCDKYTGRIPLEKKAERMDADQASVILLAAIHDLQVSMPKS